MRLLVSCIVVIWILVLGSEFAARAGEPALAKVQWISHSQLMKLLEADKS
jgi:hypothetical protein